jgi:hypothetical protein
MTMAECIEGRKTTLSSVIRDALETTTATSDEPGGWGITVEVAQVAQVFIVDAELRQQLEAEVRNEIRLRSGQSDVRAAEELRLAEMAAQDRIADGRLATDREALRRSEALFAAEKAAERARIEAEMPVRLFRVAQEAELLEREIDVQAARNRLRSLRVQHDVERARVEQELRAEILPMEQAPRIVEAASGVLRGATLSVYGDDGGIVRHVTPVLDAAARVVERTLAATAGNASGSHASE